MKEFLKVGSVVFACAAAGLAQNTLLVGGPSGLPEIRDALKIAQSGDVLLVQPGDYAYFDAQVGVTIRAVQPGSVAIRLRAQDLPSFCGVGCAFTELTHIRPPTGESTHVVGLHFMPDVVPIGFGVARNRVVAGDGTSTGHVSFEQCVFESDAMAAFSTLSGVSVFMQDCICRTTSPLGTSSVAGLSGPDISIVDCLFESSGPPVYGHAVIAIHAGTVHASGVTVTNAAGSSRAAAIRIQNAAKLYMSDSTLTAGPNSCAIEEVNGGSAIVERCVLTNTTSGCSGGTTGPGLLGVSRSGSLQLGTSFELTFRTAALDLVVVWASPALTNVSNPLTFEPFNSLDLATGIPAALLISDPNGVASPSWVLPTNPVLIDQRFWFQGYRNISLPLQTSPVVGGVIR